jgi:hypothetical protein
MTTIFDSARSVKTTRPFGNLPARERRMPFTPADLDWVAAFFGELEDNRRLEDRAIEAEWTDQFNGSIPVAPRCRVCGAGCELPITLLGDRCETASLI